MEDSASNPPPTSFQKRDALLGSSSASPAEAYQPYFEPRRGYHDTIPRPGSLHGDEGGSGQDISDFPSTSQQAALALLQDYDNGTIFAWLTGLRSLRSGSESWFHPGCLSFQQLEAISALKDCNDGLVVAWLDSARCDRQYPSHYWLYSKSSNVMVQEASMRFQITIEAATLPSRAPTQRQHAIAGKDLRTPPGPHPALSIPLRLLTTLAPVPVQEAVCGVDEISRIHLESLSSTRLLP